MSGTPCRRILLVGFMGSGKTTVGALLARALGWTFLDFDDVVEGREGRSISGIFDSRGEAYFRTVEAAVGAELLESDRVVLGAGGGWAAAEGRLDDLPPGTLSVWLAVGPKEAVRRAREQGTTRPLLQVSDPVRTAEDLLEARSRFYARAHLKVDTEGRTPQDVADLILKNLSTDAS